MKKKKDRFKPKNKNNSNTHDKRYKRLFSNPLIVEELMKYFVDFDFVNELDYSTLELQEKSFVSDEHRQSEADMIWKINYKGNDVFIYLLIEFQSTVDKYMALRFAGYIFDFYKWLSKRKDINDLPAVFPILIYNGDERWTAKDNIKDLIVGSIPPQYIPNFCYYKIIENEIPREKLIKIHNALSMVFLVENTSDEEIIESIGEVFTLLNEELPELVKEFSTWLNNLLITSGYEMGDLQKKIDNLKDTREVKTMFTTTLEKYKNSCEKKGMEKGIQKGIQKGMEKGIQKGVLKTARNLLQLGVAIDIISQATGLSTNEIEKLREPLD